MFDTASEAVAAYPPPVGKRAIIAVPDGTRPVDVEGALLALKPCVRDALVVVGLGLHRQMEPHELPQSPYPVVQHDPDDVFSTGTHHGIPGFVSRHLREGDVVFGLGIVELHQYAGFSGGHKAVAVGLGGRTTIDALHHRHRVTAPGVVLGQIDGNPFREAVDALGRAANCTWVLQVAGNRWVAGQPEAAFQTAANSLDCWLDIPTRYDAAVLVVPPKKAVNFYQASRAATYIGLSANPPLELGATLYLEASCPEGFGLGSGEQAFAELMGRVAFPWGDLLTGPAPEGGGTQRAIMLALLLQRYRVVLCGCENPAPFQAVGIEAHTQPAAALAPANALLIDDPFGKLPRLRAY